MAVLVVNRWRVVLKRLPLARRRLDTPASCTTSNYASLVWRKEEFTCKSNKFDLLEERKMHSKMEIAVKVITKEQCSSTMGRKVNSGRLYKARGEHNSREKRCRVAQSRLGFVFF